MIWHERASPLDKVSVWRRRKFEQRTDCRSHLQPLASAVDENIFAVAHAHIQGNLILQRGVQWLAGRESQASRYIEARIFVDGDRHRRQELRYLDVFGHERRVHHSLEAGVGWQGAELLELNGRVKAWKVASSVCRFATR